MIDFGKSIEETLQVAVGVTSLLFLDHRLAAAAAVKWAVIMQSYNQYNGYNKDLGA